MNRKTLHIVLALVVVVAGGAGGWVWWNRRQSARAERGLRSTSVQRGDMEVAVSASGSIQPARRVDLGFEISGQVAAVPVEVGQSVRAGELLATIAVERLRLRLAQAEANVAAAEAQVAKLKAGAQAEETEATEANLRAAEAQVEAAVGERDQLARGPRGAEIAAAEAEVASALAQQKKAQDFYDATLECVTIERSAGDTINVGGGQVITLTEDYETTICPLLGVPEEQARYRLEATNEALEAARARLEQTRAGIDQNQLRAAEANVAAAAAQRDAAQAQLDLLLEGATEEQIDTAEASLAQAQASVRQAELALEQAVLEAPFEGIIAAVNVTPGEQATPGVPVVTLLDPSLFHVNIEVDELDVGQLAVGQTARLSFDALPGTVVTGTVQHIAEAAALNGGVVTYDVRIDLAPTDAPIRTDLTTTATIVVEELNDVLLIPAWAVQVDRESGAYYVRVRRGEEIERADVLLGARQDGMAEVVDGLSAGDEVVREAETESSPFGFGGS